MNNFWHRKVVHIVGFGLFLLCWQLYTNQLSNFFEETKAFVTFKLEENYERARSAEEVNTARASICTRQERLMIWEKINIIFKVVVLVIFPCLAWRKRFTLGWFFAIGMITIPFYIELYFRSELLSALSYAL